MMKSTGTTRSTAASVTFGLSLLVAAGCHHTQHRQQACPTPIASGYASAPYTTPDEMPPLSPDTDQQTPLSDPIPPAPSEAYGEPAHRSPIQVIKEGSRKIGSKLGHLIKRDDQPAEEEAVGRAHVAAPGDSSAYSAQPQLGTPSSGQPDGFSTDVNAFPPQVPPIDDVYDEMPVNLPTENIPGDIALPDGNADYRRPQKNLMLPISNPKRDFDLYVPHRRSSTPAPQLAPVPNDAPELQQEFDQEFNDANFDAEFDANGPQLLKAPKQDAKQVQYISDEWVGTGGFQIGRLAFCSEVRSYENFSEIDRTALRSGQKLLLYNTLRNPKNVQSADGFRTLTRSHVQWLGSDGHVLREVPLEEAPDVSRSVRHDYFLTHLFDVPDSLTPGIYTVRLTVEDLFGHQSAQATLPVCVID